MNKKLQKWLEEKHEILVQGAKEYDEICKAEGRQGNYMVNTAGFDREYVGSMFIIGRGNKYLAETKVWVNEEKNRKEK